MAANGASNPGDAATPSPLPKVLNPVLTSPGLFCSIPNPLVLLALIVLGATAAVDPAKSAPAAGN